MAYNSSYPTTMNLSMDAEMVLDLRTTKVKDDPEPVPVPTYAPLTPPYCTSTGIPAPVYSPVYQTHTVLATPESPDRASLSPPTMVSSSYVMANNVINAGRSGKPTRPFKAYPKDPLALSTAPNVILGHDSKDEYMEFRQRMLAQLEIVSNRNNANMKRSTSPQMPTSTAEMDDKTAAYWERRRKNNEAAKRSRDARRAKEDEIAIRAAFLEQENMKLRCELMSLRNETAKLRCLVYNRTHNDQLCR